MQTSVIHQIKHLFLRELRQEWRNRFALMSIVLMLVVSVFIVYTIDKNAENLVWHSYFYLILIFGVVQNIGRSFLFETKGMQLYYKTLAHNKAVLLSKIVYQFLVNVVFLVILLLLMNFFMRQSIPHLWEYMVTALLFTLGNVTIFTFNSAIAKGANNSALVASVLSFPLLIPNLVVSLKSARKCMMNLDNLVFFQDWLVLIGILTITLILSLVLFRHIWSD